MDMEIFILQKYVHTYVEYFPQGVFDLPPTWVPLFYLYASMCPTASISFGLCMLAIKSRRYEYFLLLQIFVYKLNQSVKQFPYFSFLFLCYLSQYQWSQTEMDIWAA